MAGFLHARERACMWMIKRTHVLPQVRIAVGARKILAFIRIVEECTLTDTNPRKSGGFAIY